MTYRLLAPLAACAAVAALSLAVPDSAAQPAAGPAAAHSARYSYTDLGVLGGLDSRAWTLNAGGAVVGHADTSPDSGQAGFHAFEWIPTAPNGTSGSMVDLGALPGDGSSTANGINGSSRVVGESIAADMSTSRAFVYDGTMHDLGGFGGSFSAANAINAAGAIAGYSKRADGFDHAFLWIPKKPEGTKGTMYDLGTPAGRIETTASAINGLGTIAGSALDADFLSHAFVWRPSTPNGTSGTMTELPVPAGVLYSGAMAINDGGLIAGSLITAAGDTHAFIYDTAMRDLGTLPGGTTSAAYSINSSGVAVGFAETAVRANDHAVIFADGRITDLNGLLPGSAKAAGVVLTVAYGINDRGQIAGYATVSGHAHGFLLTPVS